jgi:signal transduction histidine kinase
MKTPGEAAMDLPWLAPNVASMTTLARSSPGSGASVWAQLRTDPGMVLLSARVLENPSSLDTALLEAVLNHQSHFHLGFVDWKQSGADEVHRVCLRQAILASELVEKSGGDRQRPWIAGFLAPLGWLGVAAAEPSGISASLGQLRKNTDTLGWQKKSWGHEHTALVRRLCRCWQAPPWLAAIIGNLGLHAGIAERLGAEPTLFRIVQLTVHLIQERGLGLALRVGTPAAELLKSLHLTEKDAAACVERALQAELPEQSWEAPAKHALLPELLRMALDHRRQNDAAWIERLQQNLDHLQDALVERCSDEQNRLHVLKLSALAEFAAGAGHEINNPLAVISGQAQYVLKQMDWLDVPAEEIEDVGAYLDELRGKVTPSLQKIISQTQRVHEILRELMHFARPSKPNTQPVSVRGLLSDVADSLQGLAQQRKVQMMVAGPEDDQLLLADAGQARSALSRLLRNAIEAAPANGWARVRVEKVSSALDLVVEDNGSGPAAAIREHLFDPFFSGRSAGRGRGMGLPIAWRLARQQGGDVRFDGIHSGVTRFTLTLPLAQPAVHPPLNGYHTELVVRSA